MAAKPQPITPTRANWSCGHPMESPLAGSDAPRPHCPACEGVPAPYRHVIERMMSQINAREQKLKGLQS